MIGVIRAVFGAATTITVKAASTTVKAVDAVERSIDQGLVELEHAKYQREIEMAKELQKLQPDTKALEAFQQWKASRGL